MYFLPLSFYRHSGIQIFKYLIDTVAYLYMSISEFNLLLHIYFHVNYRMNLKNFLENKTRILIEILLNWWIWRGKLNIHLISFCC